jgi:hypothetical protein
VLHILAAAPENRRFDDASLRIPLEMVQTRHDEAISGAIELADSAAIIAAISMVPRHDRTGEYASYTAERPRMPRSILQSI